MKYGLLITVINTAFCAAFLYLVYPSDTCGHGYAPEHRAELQGKINGLVPLSTADLEE